MIKKMKEVFENSKQLFLYVAILMGFVLTLLVMYKVDLSDKIPQYASHQSNQNEVQFIHDFVSGMEVEQKFKSFSDFDFITLNFVDHDQRLKGKLRIEIRDLDEEKIIIDEYIDMMSIYHTEPVKISFSEIGGGKANKQYKLRLSSSDTEERAIGIWGYQSANEKVMVNGVQIEYALSLGIHSYTSLYVNIAKMILGMSTLTIILVFASVFGLKLNEENKFLLLAVPFSICMLVLWPGNEVYDEVRHYNTVYYYSNMLLGQGENDTYKEIQMRQCDILNEDEIRRVGTPVNAQAQTYYYHVNRFMNNAENRNTITVDISEAPVVSDGSFVQYTPGIIGMTLARLLGCNYYMMMTMTRIAIIAFYLLMCYYAVYKIPVLKTLVAFVAALPMNLYQTSGISYDSFVFAVGIVVLAYIIKLWHEGFSRREWIAFAIFVFLLGNCKGGVYLTLVLLMCFIPKEKYVHKKWKKIFVTLCVAGVSMISSYLKTIFTWINISMDSYKGDTIATDVMEVAGVGAETFSLALIVTDPMKFIMLFVQTIIENMDIYLGQMLGYRTAWSSQAINIVIMLPFLILIIFAAMRKEDEKFEIGIGSKIGMLAMVLVEVIGMHMIFLMHTSIYNTTIWGVQGRYFILFIPFIILGFRSESVVYKGNENKSYLMFSMAQMIYWYFFLRMFMIH